MEPCSLYGWLQCFTTQLNLVNQGMKQFNEEFALVDPSSSSQKTKQATLKHFEKKLEKAPIHYLHSEIIQKFNNQLNIYVSTKDNKSLEYKKVKNIQKKVNEKAKRVFSCFQTDAVRHIDAILNKKDLAEKDQEWLLNIANIIAYDRVRSQRFCLHSLIIEKIASLQSKHPYIRYTQIDDKKQIHLDSPMPNTLEDILLFLQVLFKITNGADKALSDEKFLKEIITHQITHPNSNLQEFFQDVLIASIIHSLCTQFDQIIEDTTLKTAMEKECYLQEEYQQISRELFHKPKSFSDIGKQLFPWRPIDCAIKGHPQVAKDLQLYMDDTATDFDTLYQAMYKKLEGSVFVPEISPDDFAKRKNLLNKDLMDLSRENWIRTTTEEIQKENSSNLAREESTVATQNSQIHSTDESAKILPSPPSSPVLIDSLKNENLEEIPISSTVELEKDLQTLLNASSPFAVHDRVIRWLDPTRNPIEEDEKYQNTLPQSYPDIHFRHNFAWIANSILWQLGLSYMRENQSAIAMLCQKEDALGKELFRATITFDGKITNSSMPTCYHRALTRIQQEKLVEQYFSLAQDQHIEFPLLPSQQPKIDIPQAWFSPSGDGSYVESVNGGVISVYDPKNKKKLHFFVVK